jgi:hypothetical protein
MKISRLPAHLVAEFTMRRHFPAHLLDKLQQAIADSEMRHDGQVCFAIEGAQNLRAWWRGTTPRQRAEEVFAHLRVWDTQDNNGANACNNATPRASSNAVRSTASRPSPNYWLRIFRRNPASATNWPIGRFCCDVTSGLACVS